MRLEPWWYGRTAIRREPPLTDHVICDAVVVGGGVAGLHAALRLSESGLDVVLLEKFFCGAGASGKSSGFLTPDSELELHELIRRFGKEDAERLWTVALNGVALLAETARRHEIDCDLQQLDSLFLGVGRGGADSINKEAEARESLGYPYRLYTADALRAVHPGAYDAGVRYADTYAIDPLRYSQGLKIVLCTKGVRVFEGSEVLGVNATTVRTAAGSVSAGQVLVCVNGMTRDLSRDASKKIYHAQTFLAVSERLTPTQIKLIFPEEPLQCWDSTLVYTYYRLTSDERLLLGGGLALTTFAPREIHSSLPIRRVIRGFRKRFPGLRRVPFVQHWPGLIDITRDLLPVADSEPDHPSLHYVLGSAGLPWAGWCGDYAARRALGLPVDDYGRFFGFDRPPLVPDPLQRLIGKPAAFAIDYFYAKYGESAE